MPSPARQLPLDVTPDQPARTPALGVPLSILDRSRTRTGETEAQALRETVRFAQQAEELGYHRFWVSEHHNMRSLACSAVSTSRAGSVTSGTSSQHAV